MCCLHRLLVPATLFLLPALPACGEDRLPLGGFGRFPLGLLGDPSRLGLFPRLTFGFASRGFGGLPGGQFGRLTLLRCSSAPLALHNPIPTRPPNLRTGP